ncbi:MAG: DUF6062 family protein [Oscillospiraceae bacterium]|nr:DUF6062 family protein [Oscillospiraceae bacterium]
MRIDISNIPLAEVFEPAQGADGGAGAASGCPLCRLRDRLEKRVVSYIVGPAMMEPDVRQQTNALGFCHRHYGDLIKEGSRLSVALMLQSHLDEIDKCGLAISPKGETQGAGMRAAVRSKKDTENSPRDSCFVCTQVDAAFQRLLINLCVTWERDEAFRELFKTQPMLCLPHFRALARAAAIHGRRSGRELTRTAAALCRGELERLQTDIGRFCRSFDYRSTGESGEVPRDAIERSVRWLTGREV